MSLASAQEKEYQQIIAQYQNQVIDLKQQLLNQSYERFNQSIQYSQAQSVSPFQPDTAQAMM